MNNNIIMEIKVNDEAPTKYDYKYFEAILSNGETKVFNYHINNPMPTSEEMIGLTWDELINLCREKFYDAIKQHISFLNCK